MVCRTVRASFERAQLPGTHLALAGVDFNAVLSHKQQVLDGALKDHLAHADRGQKLAWRRPEKENGIEQDETIGNAERFRPFA
jgi:hypothetical protein